jgi:hypothetical protein
MKRGVPAMRIKLDLPQEIAEALETEGCDLSRTVLEALALEGFRAGKLSVSQVRRFLDYRTRHEVDAFLREHGVPTPCTEQDFEQDIGIAAGRTLARELSTSRLQSIFDTPHVACIAGVCKRGQYHY